MARKTLETWIADSNLDRAIAVIFGMVGDCAVEISVALRVASAAGDTGAAQTVNVQGEVQKKLDVVANDIFLRRGAASGVLAAMVSEELDDIELVAGVGSAHHALVFDPLDGSSNLEINGAVGSIFSVLDLGKSSGITASDVLQPGKNQVAAGYVLYGPATLLVLTTGQAVTVFSLDEASAEFVMVRDKVEIPAEAAEFAINASRQTRWYAPTRSFIDACIAGKSGPFGKTYNMRWCAAMVADLHRILCRGGIFLYPEDEDTKGKGGRLRLLYEANPMSMIVEAAGGASTTGTERLLDVEPSNLHQRIGVIIGSRGEVERAKAFY
ncbi:class 1 fructose-bisphosphatase [Pelagibacterium halotolerans]|uniref:Fructose-1,6-bisphosphatase class 1 n=1 Tax=Pelagibacterium halotolerans (strain DSM 22347 / JCM 15775 / CGMCC 1.7692 / B2) TaxID=1082931 RepID=G4RCQ1_PELHB|nr:class 1 fructose-bisphosphatase [Pelagibacterium halotolerans]AEQ51706.1 fructose-1,6-bisphosphatase, type I [Pelagibacterium halotolerans B2]QJR18473.1 class 1 fructose-bisphosphatase [Pelagibacterium halotolerans]SEA20932.1 D-fructose 1,6-bisphosphatase [Pelagibacterium halotolerans]